MPTYSASMDFTELKPRDIWKLYRNGFPGAHYRPKELESFLAESRTPLFGAVAEASGIAGSGDGKTVALFPHVLKHDPDAYKDSQKTGDCVSHGTRSAVDLSRVVEIEVRGEPEGFYVKGATEAIYGSRGHGGQGMSCAGAARFVTSKGGILLRKDYTAEFGLDLSSYKDSYKFGMKWGRSGVPDAVIAEARKHQVGTAALLSTVQDVRDAIANGYGISCCSSLGFSSKRGEYGVSRRSGSWSHCMMVSAFDMSERILKKFGRAIYLIQNSWGRFNSGTKWLNQPDGSFWVIERDMEAIVRSRGTFAFSTINGFPPVEMPDWGYNWGALAA